MASDINPGNIDGTFPIAGIDNDSQGFRTNFTNTSTNFTEAKSEIEDLQSKSILKAPLNGESVTDNDMLGEQLKSATLLDTREVIFSHGDEVSGAVNIDHQNGQYQTLSTVNGGAIVITAINFPATTFGRVRVEMVIDDVADTVTLASSISLGLDNIRGLVGLIITFEAAGTYTFDFTSYDNTVWTLIDISRRPSLEPLTINTQTENYEAVLTDANIMISMDNGSARTVTIPVNSGVAYDIGTQLHFIGLGAGTVTIAIDTDTLNSAGSLFDLNGQYARAVALKITATTWILSGNLA